MLNAGRCAPIAHGTVSKNIDNEHMYLDPIKVTLLTPGMKKDGTMDDFGIPASIVAKYLDEHGIVVEKNRSVQPAVPVQHRYR